VLTREGAVGWSHFYTASFLHEYLQATDSPADNPAYVERLAKFSSRVIAGATLAQLDTQQLDAIKPQLIAAVQAAGPERSTDETISALLINHPDTAPLLDEESQALLRTAGMIRSGAATEVPATFATDAEARLFYESFQQGIERRGTQGEDADILTSYALGELIKDMGELQVYPPGGKLTVQGATEQSVMYIPLKTHDKQDNNGVTIEVRNDPADETIHYARTAGRVVGEGSIFGLPRSATVIANGNTEAFVIDADKLKGMLRDPAIQQQLTERTLTSREARRTDVLLRYFTREAGIYTRQTLPYTNLARNQQTPENLGENPLAGYDMGQDFLRILEAFSTEENEADTTFAPVVTLTSQDRPRPLFETGSTNEHLYVVADGTVAIELQNGEHVTVQTGELFGESALLGLPATGRAAVSENSTVIAVSAPWFTRFTQSRKPMQFEHMPPDLRDKLPVQLQYHIAFKGYELVRRRLATQTLTQ